MVCRQCGTEIAAKAIICYKCGMATAEPSVGRGSNGGRGFSSGKSAGAKAPAYVWWIIIVVLAAAAWWWLRSR